MIINTGKVSLLYAKRAAGGMQYMKKYTGNT